MLPKDSYILVSVINTYLRDTYPSLSDLCEDKEEDEEGICRQLAGIGYAYDPEQNRFQEKIAR